MHHKSTLTITNFPTRPYHIKCACGTAGDFRNELEAKNWMTSFHFARLSGIDTYSHYDEVNPFVALPATIDEPPHPQTESAPVSGEQAGAGSPNPATVFDQKQPVGASVDATMEEAKKKQSLGEA